jgi:hypothetical protein
MQDIPRRIGEGTRVRFARHARFTNQMKSFVPTAFVPFFYAYGNWGIGANLRIVYRVKKPVFRPYHRITINMRFAILTECLSECNEESWLANQTLFLDQGPGWPSGILHLRNWVAAIQLRVQDDSRRLWMTSWCS